MASIRCLDVAWSGNYFACGSADRTASLWSFPRRYPIRLFMGHASDVTAVQFSPNGVLLATGSYDGSTRLWDCRSAQLARHMKLKDPATGVTADKLAFSPNGALIATVGDTVTVWDVSMGKPLTSWRATQSCGGPALAVAFGRGSRYLATAYRGGALVFSDIWTLSSNDGAQEGLPAKSLRLDMPDKCIGDMCFSPENVLLTCTVPLLAADTYTVTL